MLKFKKLISVVAIFSLITTNFVGFANASSLTNASDSISNSDMSAIATHTVRFTINTALYNTDRLDIVMPAAFGTSSFMTGCFAGSATSTPVARTYRCTATTTIATGTPLTVTVAGVSNPVTSGSQTITVSSYTSGMVLKESANVMVAVISNVDVSASVPATLSFNVSSIATGTVINGATTTASSTATALTFGNLQVGTSSILGQQLAVSTNGAGGFVVTVQQNQDLTSSGGSKIFSFASSTASTTPWSNPLGVLDASSTYGHLALTTNDWTLTGLLDPFGATSSSKYTGFTTTNPVEVMYHNGAADGITPSKGMARVAYRIQISALQPAGDYSNILTYIATPTY